jgi:hypothetical protein
MVMGGGEPTVEAPAVSTTTTWHVTIPLDGFIAGSEGSIDWAAGYGGVGWVADEIAPTTGPILPTDGGTNRDGKVRRSRPGHRRRPG